MKPRFDLTAAAALALGAGMAQAQDGHMMNGGGWAFGGMGSYGGVWIPVLLAVIVGLLIWIVMQRRK